MMSDPSKTPIGSTPPPVSVSAVPVGSFMQNGIPSSPMYYAPPSNQGWIPTVTPQMSLAAVKHQNDQSSPFFLTFLKGKPKALGILIICAAIIEIALGIALVCTIFAVTVMSGIVFWGPIFYIIAGSLTIAAQAKPNGCLIKGSLSLNIISSICCVPALIINGIDLVILYCDDYHGEDYYSSKCQAKLIGGYTIISLLIVTNLLLLCVTISSSIFGCRSISKVEKLPQVIVIQNDFVVSMNPGTYPVMTQSAPPSYQVTATPVYN